MMDLICLGEILIDFLPGNEDGIYIRKLGGAPANVAVAAARNGFHVGFCGCLGNDDFGRFLLETLKQNRVHFLCPELTDEAVTTMAFVTLDAQGERSFTFARKPGADMLLTRWDIKRANVTQASIVQAGSFSLSCNPAADATRYAMEAAHQAGKLVGFDINYRNLVWNDNRTACINAVREVLPLVDFLKVSEEETDMLGMPLEEAARIYNIAVLVETLGPNGARFCYQGKSIHVPGRKVPCVDTTGAGDAFWGGFLSCLLQNGVTSTSDLTEEIVLRAVRYGNVAGSLSVQKKGAIESMPTTDEILAILNRET